MLLDKVLRILEELKDTLDIYNPIKFESSNETKLDAAEKIPQLYGSIEEIYKNCTGVLSVEVSGRGSTSIYPNYFEAGYLSGRSIYAHQGYQELLKVIGRVRIQLDQNGLEAPDDSGNDFWLLLHPKVKEASKQRFESKHYADAAEAALKALGNEVRDITLGRGAKEIHGVGLMRTAFSLKNPIIVLGDLQSQSGRDIQQGYMDMFAGSMSAIRNPKAHDNLNISPERAIHFLYMASMLWFKLDERL